MTYPKRVDAFKEWAKLMTEQALVPDRIQYKGSSTSSRKKTSRIKKRNSRKRRKRVKKEE